jgi:hypothetical protein
MFDSSPTVEVDSEAHLVSVRPTPGAVFLRLRQRQPDGGERCLFVEMTVGEAVALRRELDACIGIAATTGGT